MIYFTKVTNLAPDLHFSGFTLTNPANPALAEFGKANPIQPYFIIHKTTLYRQYFIKYCTYKKF